MNTRAYIAIHLGLTVGMWALIIGLLAGCSLPVDLGANYSEKGGWQVTIELSDK